MFSTNSFLKCYPQTGRHTQMQKGKLISLISLDTVLLTFKTHRALLTQWCCNKAPNSADCLQSHWFIKSPSSWWSPLVQLGWTPLFSAGWRTLTLPQLFTGTHLTKQPRCLHSHYLILFIVNNFSNWSHVQTSRMMGCVFFQILPNTIKHHTSHESITTDPTLTPAWCLLARQLH